ncbi:formyltetrahydrofolate deformylase [Burkholderia pyrrocinia]|uniref:formyltetrahydrofolate deformylase n=1 Tax=Burkholderia pyrrocinia TaxID=60550 RepID=UPI002AAF576C|nr:formyltetrahydrofolate deformylase [Burkholderia pyrrocinia]
MENTRYIINLRCKDHAGIVRDVATFVSSRGGNIVQSNQSVDEVTGQFFLRMEFETPVTIDGDTLKNDFSSIGEFHRMKWYLTEADLQGRVLVMVSQYGHCLNDLLFRARIGALKARIVGIVSNHETFRGLAEHYEIPFHFLPITAETKADRELQLLQLIDESNVDLVVLARYMQILSASLCDKLEGRIINIHHSFLPSFKGAKPYHQAHARGVKLIGATAHYVTSDLDEGPIIEQEVVRVDHGMSPTELASLGRDVECSALSRAVQWHLEQRIILDDNRRTVVFR